jgi:ribokinase
VSGAVLEVHPGGKGANQAVAAARCGALVDLVGRVGADQPGTERLEQLAAEGVRTAQVRQTPGVATGAAFITVTPDGENSIVVAPGANDRLAPADVEAARAPIQDAAVLVAQLEVPLDAVARAAALIRRGRTFVLNAAPVRQVPRALLAVVDVLVVNELEAASLCGRPVSSRDEARLAAVALAELGPAAVVITLGALGAVATAAGRTLEVPSPAVGVVDTTGAGDAFVGALAARLASGGGLECAVELGVAVGSATTEVVGALPRLPPDLR